MKSPQDTPKNIGKEMFHYNKREMQSNLENLPYHQPLDALFDETYTIHHSEDKTQRYEATQEYSTDLKLKKIKECLDQWMTQALCEDLDLSV
jgi:hypothetical protein